MQGYIDNIEKITLENTNFRKVLYTGRKSQLVVMCLKPGEDIGAEIHDGHDQFFRIEQGKAKVIINDTEKIIENDWAAIVPSGANHNVINVGDEDLKLYTIYSPAEHPEGTIHATKEEALTAEH